MCVGVVTAPSGAGCAVVGSRPPPGRCLRHPCATRDVACCRLELTNTKTGVSAVSLSRSLDLRYETSWYLLHKLRAAMSFVGHDRLRGDVELDETFVGGFAEGTGSGGAHARSSNITTVIVAAERAAETTIGRIRMARSLDSSVLCLARFISDNVESGAIQHTDGWPSYEPALKLFALEGLRYERRPVAMGSAGHDHDYLFGVHRAASLLKRWLLGTHQGSVSAHQIDHYLAEFVFRFNRRASRSRGLLFWALSARSWRRNGLDRMRSPLGKPSWLRPTANSHSKSTGTSQVDRVATAPSRRPSSQGASHWVDHHILGPRS